MSSIQAIGKVKLALASRPEASSPPLSLPRRRGRTSIPFSWALGFALPEPGQMAPAWDPRRPGTCLPSEET